MNTNYKQMPRGQVRLLVPPHLVTMITGVWNARQDRTGRITLAYTDGTTEHRKCAHDAEDFGSFDAIVSFVQAGRGVTP